MSDNKNLQYFEGEKVGADAVYGHMEAWPFLKKADIGEGNKPNKPVVTLRKIMVKGKETSVADITVSLKANDSKIKFLFGEEFVPSENNSLIMKVSLWGMVADNFVKYNPSLQQVIGFTGKFTVSEYNGKKSIQMTATGWKPVTKKKPELAFDGEVTPITSGSTGSTEVVSGDQVPIPF